MSSVTLTTPVLSKYRNEIFVETGTLGGGGILLALQNGFQKVFSIEFDRDLYEKAVARFAGDARVHLFQGDSGRALAELLTHVDRPATFWLDAHAPDSTPLWAELHAIAVHPIRSHTILIDDRRLFEDWGIDEDGVRRFLLEVNPSYRFKLEPNFTSPTDIFVAVPGV